MHVPQNSDKIRLWGAKVMWVLEIENFTILKQIQKTQNAKVGQKIQTIFVKNLEVWILGLNMEDTIGANNPEVYKEKEKSTCSFFPVNLIAEASHTTLVFEVST